MKQLGRHSLARGFTLLEVMLAMAIFAVIGVMAMTGYSQLARQSENLQLTMQRIRNVQLTMSRFTQDFAELEPRPVRDALGSNFEPAVFADNRGQSIVQFTRAGWSNPAAIARSTLQRAAYRIENGKLYRDHWIVLDRTLATQPVKVELVDQVISLKLRYLDRNRVWSEQWPTAAMSLNSAQGSNDSERPVAIEVTLELEDWGKLVRLIEVPG